ncbi:MAG: deoxyribonuclease [Candidatus Binatus sp.]|nr:deoxyribonuclease [Candidatus Binatus sp.]
MIDSHVHLDADQYADPSGAIKRALEANISAIVVPGVGPESNLLALELARTNPGVVYTALGFHPERFELTDVDVQRVADQIRQHRDLICAIGEVGLPWYGEQAHDETRADRARRRLQTFAALATKLDLPLILHAPHRRAGEALSIIEAAGVRRAAFHWHKSDEATTRAIIAAGYYISMTPDVVYRERDQELARMLRLDRMIVESDGPWSYGGPFAGQITEPAIVRHVVAAIAHIRCATFEEIAAVTDANTRRLFAIPAGPASNKQSDR